MAGERDLLELARHQLEQHLGRECGEWVPVKQFERPRSEIQVFESAHSGGRTVVFLKRVLVPQATEAKSVTKVQSARTTLRREMEIRQDALAAFSAAGVRFDYPLAVDPNEMTGVRLGVEGDQLKGARLRLFGPRWPFARIGSLIALIEDVGSGRDQDLGPHEREALVGQILTWCSTKVDRQLQRALERRLGYFLDSRVDCFRQVWSHKDISRTNLLRAGDGLGVIDFSWATTFPGRDLAHFLSRCEIESKRTDRRRRVQLVSGYVGLHEHRFSAVEFALLERAGRSIKNRRTDQQEWGLQLLNDLAKLDFDLRNLVGTPGWGASD